MFDIVAYKKIFASSRVVPFRPAEGPFIRGESVPREPYICHKGPRGIYSYQQ